jgi:hypothetical protein
MTADLDSEAVAAEPAGSAGRHSALMRELNNTLGSRSPGEDKAQLIAFFCECGLSGCFTAVWKTRTDFQATVEEGENWMLAEGHRASAPSSAVQHRLAPEPVSS